jgi:streptogramin lyase
MRLWRRWLCALIFGSLTWGWVGTVGAEGIPQVGAGGNFAQEPSLVVVNARWLLEGQLAAAEAARRANPYSAMTRAASATAFGGLSAAAAKRLADKAFASVIDGRQGGPPRLPAGERITRFASPSSAQVSLGAASRMHALIQSTQPMAAMSSPGRWRPLDLGLRRAGAAFVGVAPLVPARLPTRLSEGAQLPTVGLSVTPVDAHGASLKGSTDKIDGASVFIANTLRDSDSVFKLSTFGLSADAILRSQYSPAEISFRVGMPKGARLAPGRSGAVRVIKEGETIAHIPAPSALDAAGAFVPVDVAVSGDVVTLTVTRHAGEYRYPIEVDPEFNVTTDSKIESRDWPASGEFPVAYEYNEATIYTTSASPGQWGAINYVTKGVSKIYEINTSNTFSPTAGYEIGEYQLTTGEDYIEFADPGGTENRVVITKEHTPLHESPLKTHACASSVSCSPEVGAAGNTVRLVQRATTSYSGNWFSLTTTSAAVGIAQPKETHSTVSYNASAPELEYTSGGKLVKTPNVVYTGGWIGPHSGAFEYTAKDLGLGVSASAVEVYKGTTWSTPISHNFLPTTGCAGVQCAEAQKEIVTYSMLASSLANGNNTIRVSAHDPMAKTSSTEHGEGERTLKVDAAAPSGITVSGLAAKEGDLYEIDESATHQIKVEAKDGEGATPSSGIKSIVVGLDGQEIGATGPCTPGPCVAKGEWSINGGELGAGIHTLTVVATDNAANVASTSYSLYVHHAGAARIGPGAVNVESGNFQLSATDVSMSGGMGGLTVTRSYQSRNPQAGAGGPLGPQWSIGLGSAATLRVAPDGSVLLVGPEGGVLFAKKAGGGFESPTGDGSLTLEKVEQLGKVTAYLLKNPTKGTTTRYTLPAGAEEWLPTVSEGANATTTTTDEYVTVEPEPGRKIVRPILEVAPHPSATCAFKKLEKGCRALEFNYAESTTATGEGQTEWGDYKGDLTRVYLVAWDPTTKEMKTTTVAQYAYDTQGRLRAVWDPRISPALKTIYGYDAEGHIAALTPPGEESWAFIYGTITGDATSGRLLKATRAATSAPLWNGSAAVNTQAPSLSGSPIVGARMTVSDGAWSNQPVAYAYQWLDCNGTGAECKAIAGANNPNYTPTSADLGHTIVAKVTAINGAGASAAVTAHSTAIQTQGLEELSSQSLAAPFQCPQRMVKGPDGNIWFTDPCGHQVGKITTSGVTTAYNLPSTSSPAGIAVGADNNVWVTLEATDKLARITTAGAITEYSLPAGSKPVGIAGASIDLGGWLWVAESGLNRIAKVGTNGVVSTQYTLPAGSTPYAMTLDNADEPWFTEKGSDKVGWIGTAIGTGLSETALPAGSDPSDIVLGNGTWVAEEGTSKIAKLGGGEYALPAGARPTSVTFGTDGNIWFTENANNKIGEVTTHGVITEYALPAGSAPFDIIKSPAGDHMSFTESTANRIGAIATRTITPHLASGNCPTGLTVGPDANLWSTNPCYSTVEKMTTSGTKTSYTLPTTCPEGITVGPDGNMWMAEKCADKVGKITTAGTFSDYLLPGGSKPVGIASGPDGNLWLTESATNKIVKVTTAGAYTQYALPAGSEPMGITSGPDGNLWFTEQASSKVGKITTGGTITEYALPAGSKPFGIAIGPDGNLWVAYLGTNKVGKVTTAGVITEYAIGTGTTARSIVTGPDGNLWFTESSVGQVGTITTAGVVREFSLSSLTGTPYSIVAGPNGDGVWVAEEKNHDLTYISTPYFRVDGAARSPQPGITVEYNVPVSGSGSPYGLGSSEAAKWGQTDVAATATAIFPADEPQEWPASDYKRATVYYMDALARTTNIAAPSGAISTMEYNEQNETVRTLSAANRAQALEEGAKSAEVAKLLDREDVYHNEGSQLAETLGPQHLVKIVKGNEKVPSGSEVLARDRVKYFYNEGAPETGELYDLVTKTTDGALTAGGEEFDVRTTTKSYSGQGNLGWKLRSPTSATIDPTGLKLTHTTVYDEATGAVVEARGAASTGSGDPHNMVTVYYSAGANASYPACGGHVEWAGLMCETLPGKQPETSGLPPLAVTTYTYDMLNQSAVMTETFGSVTRTKKTTFDAAGRPLTSEVTSTNGATPVPAVTSSYDEKTGALVKQSETFEGKEKAIKTFYDKIGRVEAYEDADSAYTTYLYDIDNRPTSVTEWTQPEGAVRGKQTYVYDPVSGRLAELVDSAAGKFTATYDVAGRMTSETYPNKMTAVYSVNTAGETTGVEYVKTAYCAASCPERWANDTIVPAIHGEVVKESSMLAEEPKISYDADGRLTEVQEIPAGQGCTTRIYTYDAESNRTGLTTRPPDAEGKCTTTGGTVESHTYDSGNRLTDSGVTYGSIGNVTYLPAADAGGSGMAISSTYYVDSQLATQTQNGTTTSYYMDPESRLRETRRPAVSVTHYASPGQAVAWISEPESKWTRNVPGIDGSIAGTQTSAGVMTLMVHDLQGNAVGTAALDEKQTKLLTTYKSTEFGVPTGGAPPKYAWLGALGVTSESPTGLVVQSGVAYVPQTGQPLQTSSISLPSPDNVTMPYEMKLAPWVVEGTATVVKQLTEAEEAAQKAAEGGSGDVQEVFDASFAEKDYAGDGADASAVPQCWVKWKLSESSQGGGMYLAGWFQCLHHVANFELRLCMFWKYPGRTYKNGVCAGSKGFLRWTDVQAEEVLIYHPCLTGIVYTGWVWGRAWIGNKPGTVFVDTVTGNNIKNPNYPRMACEGRDPGSAGEEAEILN